GRTVPIRSLHDGVDETGHVGLTGADQGRWMLAILAIRHDPGYRWQCAVFSGSVETGELLDIAQLTVLLHRIEVGQRIPDLWCSRVLWFGGAGHRGVIFAIGLCPVGHIISPTYIAFVKEVGQVCPGIIRSFYCFFTCLDLIGILQCVLTTHGV